MAPGRKWVSIDFTVYVPYTYMNSRLFLWLKIIANKHFFYFYVLAKLHRVCIVANQFFGSVLALYKLHQILIEILMKY